MNVSCFYSFSFSPSGLTTVNSLFCVYLCIYCIYPHILDFCIYPYINKHTYEHRKTIYVLYIRFNNNTFCILLFLHESRLWTCFQLVHNVSTTYSFQLLYNYYIVQIHPHLFNHSLIVEHLGCFWYFSSLTVKRTSLSIYS